MVGDFVSGFRFVSKGFGLINQPGVRAFVVVPLIINITLFSIGIWYAGSQFSYFLDWLFSYLPGWLDWLRWILWPLFAITILVAVFYTFTLIANFIAAPFNSLLAERLEMKLTGQPLEGGESSLKALLKGAGEAFMNELKKFGYLLLWVIPLLILTVIPVINIVAPFAWAAFSAWMLALEYTDYPMGNHQMFFKDERALLGRHK